MRNCIKHILKEETNPTYVQKVVGHLLTNIKGGAHVPRFRDIVSEYGLTDDDIEYLNNLEEEALDRLKGISFNVTDYIGKVSIGGYDFKFVVRGLYGEEYMGVDTYGIADEDDTFPQVNWTLEAVVLLRGSTVELMATGEEITLETAIDNPDYGWEIESEIGDLIHDIVSAEEPIPVYPEFREEWMT